MTSDDHPDADLGVGCGSPLTLSVSGELGGPIDKDTDGIVWLTTAKQAL